MSCPPSQSCKYPGPPPVCSHPSIWACPPIHSCTSPAARYSCLQGHALSGMPGCYGIRCFSNSARGSLCRQLVKSDRYSASTGRFSPCFQGRGLTCQSQRKRPFLNWFNKMQTNNYNKEWINNLIVNWIEENTEMVDSLAQPILGRSNSRTSSKSTAKFKFCYIMRGLPGSGKSTIA